MSNTSNESTQSFKDLALAIAGVNPQLSQAADISRRLQKAKEDLSQAIIKGHRVSKEEMKSLKAIVIEKRKMMQIDKALEKEIKKAERGMLKYIDSMKQFKGHARSLIGTVSTYTTTLGAQAFTFANVTKALVKYRAGMFSLEKSMNAAGGSMDGLDKALARIKNSTNQSQQAFLDFANSITSTIIGAIPDIETLAKVMEQIELRSGGNKETMDAQKKVMAELQQNYRSLHDEIIAYSIAMQKAQTTGNEEAVNKLLEKKLGLQDKIRSSLGSDRGLGGEGLAAMAMLEKMTPEMEKQAKVQQQMNATAKKGEDAVLSAGLTSEKAIMAAAKATESLLGFLERVPALAIAASASLALMGAAENLAPLLEGLRGLRTLKMFKGPAKGLKGMLGGGGGGKFYKGGQFMPGGVRAPAGGAMSGVKGLAKLAPNIARLGKGVGVLAVAFSAFKAAKFLSMSSEEKNARSEEISEMGHLRRALEGLTNPIEVFTASTREFLGSRKAAKEEKVSSVDAKKETADLVAAGEEKYGKQVFQDKFRELQKKGRIAEGEAAKGGADVRSKSSGDYAMQAAKALRVKDTKASKASKESKESDEPLDARGWETERRSQETRLKGYVEIQAALDMQISSIEEMGGRPIDELNRKWHMLQLELDIINDTTAKLFDTFADQASKMDFGDLKLDLNMEGLSDTDKMQKILEIQRQISGAIADGSLSYKDMEPLIANIAVLEKQRGVQLSKEKDVTNAMFAKAEATVTQAEKHTSIVERRLAVERKLMESAQFGMGASVDMLQKQVSLADKLKNQYAAVDQELSDGLISQKLINPQQMEILKGSIDVAEAEKYANSIRGEGTKGAKDLVKYYIKHNELTTKQMEKQQDIYDLTKDIREGYLSAMKAMAVGSSKFDMIIGSQTKGARQIIEMTKRATGAYVNTMGMGGMGSRSDLSANRQALTGEFTIGGLVMEDIESRNKDITSYGRTELLKTGKSRAGTANLADAQRFVMMQASGYKQKTGGISSEANPAAVVNPAMTDRSKVPPGRTAPRDPSAVADFSSNIAGMQTAPPIHSGGMTATGKIYNMNEAALRGVGSSAGQQMTIVIKLDAGLAMTVEENNRIIRVIKKEIDGE